MNTSFDIIPLTGSLGAKVVGVDLANLSNADFDKICAAFFKHSVLVFPDQDITLDDQVDFARRFGTLEVHPIVNGMEGKPEVIKMLKPAGESASFGVGWHTDNSFFEEPSMGSIVHAQTIPPYGGDTLFASQYVAYERLSDGMKAMLEGMKAIHTAKDAYTSDTAQEKYEGKTAITYRWSD
ncbi:MAG: taurine dioxygenase, partial [Parvibaculaceae bacterium]